MAHAVITTALHHVVELLDGWRVGGEVLADGQYQLLGFFADVESPLTQRVHHVLSVEGVVTESPEVNARLPWVAVQLDNAVHGP